MVVKVLQIFSSILNILQNELKTNYTVKTVFNICMCGKVVSLDVKKVFIKQVLGVLTW